MENKIYVYSITFKSNTNTVKGTRVNSNPEEIFKMLMSNNLILNDEESVYLNADDIQSIVIKEEKNE